MAKKDKDIDRAYIKHQHKVMVLVGLAIILFTYSLRSHIGVIFGALIVGAAIARVKD